MKNRLWAAGAALLVSSLFIFQLSHAQMRDTGPHLQVTPAVTRILIDSIARSLYRNYIFPDTAKKMTAYLDAQYKKGAYNDITDPGVLARRLLQDLQKAHHDGHLSINYAPPFEHELSDTTGMAERRKVGDSIGLAHEQLDNFGFHRLELLRGNIGYLVFHGFSGFIDEARPTIASAMRFLSHSRALIIDLRENGGGSPGMVSAIESYFFPERTHMNDIVDRVRGTTEFWTDPGKTEGVIMRMPVYILTSKSTFSGAEDFSYGMQKAKRAKVVGDTTGGGAHPTRPFPLGQGFVMGVPFARSLNPYTNTDWEGTGVIPDIVIPSDNALVAVEEIIYKDLIGQAPNEEEKKRLQWRFDDLRAKQSASPRDSASLAQYTGSYRGGLVFFVRGGSLICRNAERGNAEFKLIPIAGDSFILDENVHVRFIKDAQGRFSGIDMWFFDGRMVSKPRDQAHQQ